MRNLPGIGAVCALAVLAIACTPKQAVTGAAASPISATTPPTGGTLVGRAAYICANGLRFQAIFQDNPSQVRLTNVENVVYLLPQQPSDKGYVFSDGVSSFTILGKDANFSAPGVGSTACTDVTESK